MKRISKTVGFFFIEEANDIVYSLSRGLFFHSAWGIFTWLLVK